MTDTLQFELVAPERLIFSGDVEMVVVPGTDGDFGVLPGHALLISTLRPGVIEIYEGEKPKGRYVVAEGFAEVTGERCTVLSAEAFEPAAIDQAEAKARFERAQLALRDAEGAEERTRYEREAALAELLAANAA